MEKSSQRARGRAEAGESRRPWHTRARSLGRAFLAATLSVALSGATSLSSASAAPPADPQSAAADLAHASDFRVRVSAALVLGKTRPEGARLMLEKALEDPHAAVRTAAAAALAAVGDRAAVPTLERHARGETSGAARAQMQTSIAQLSRGDVTGAAAPHGRVRYAVAIGQMRNLTGVRDGELAQILRESARAQAASLPGAVVYDASDPAAERAADRMPVLLLEGQLTRLSQSSSNGSTRIEARVEFSVRRVPQQTLKGTLSGGATAVEPTRTLSGSRLADAQNQAVGSAVESALRGADTGLALAAK
jgi:hypothetical protein